MPIEKDRRLAGRLQGFRIHQRMQIGRNDLNSLESGRAQVIANPPGRTFNIRFVFALRAHARNAQKFVQLREMRLAPAFNEFRKFHRDSLGYEPLILGPPTARHKQVAFSTRPPRLMAESLSTLRVPGDLCRNPTISNKSEVVSATF